MINDKSNIEVGSLKYLWNEHRSTIIVSTLNLLRARPLICFSVGYFITNPSAKSFILFALNILVTELYANILANRETFKVGQSLFKNNLVEFYNRKVGFTADFFFPSDFLDEKTYEHINTYAFSGAARVFGKNTSKEYELDKIVSFICLNDNDSIFGNAAAFSGSTLDQSIILFDHKPTECGPIQNFILLHEIGHTVVGWGKNTFYSMFKLKFFKRVGV